MNSQSADRLGELGEAEEGLFGERVLGSLPEVRETKELTLLQSAVSEHPGRERQTHKGLSTPFSARMTPCPHGSSLGKDHALLFLNLVPSSVCAQSVW